MNLFQQWKNWALPSFCALCGTGGVDDTHLCPGCQQQLLRLSTICPRCSSPTATGDLCARCLLHPPAFDKVFSAYRYAFPLDRLIQNFKYGGQLALVPLLARLLAEGIAPHTVECDIVIALPLARARRIERGFNQAHELARPIARQLALPLIHHALVRVKNTAKQSTLPWEKRHANMRDAFTCVKPLPGLRVLLIDDVMTSGATLEAAAIALKKVGATSVKAAVVARAGSGT